MRDQTYYNVTAGVIALAAVACAVGTIGVQLASPPSEARAGTVSYLNLTIAVNSTTGWPQYSPANFSLPSGTVEVTIADHDMPMSWTGCACEVTGTVGGVETVNGAAESVVPSSNVAHTFTIGAFGLNVLSPGGSVVTFSLDLPSAGTYVRYCMAPCGGGDPYGSPPMGTPGYMTGTMTVL